MNKIQQAKEKLSKYGDLITCKTIKEDVVLIFIIKDTSEEPIKIFEILAESAKCFPEHTILNTGINESHHALVVLTKPS